ncbi:MAG: SurA N-terminal domain-containing protein [Polyangiaceae bacterium]
MLSVFRRGGAGQVIVGAVVFAIIIVFALEFRAGRGDTASLSRECAVEVYGRCVDRKEFVAALRLAIPRGMQDKRIRAMSLNRQVMEGLVERELLLQEAERLGISISEAEIDDELTAGRAYVSLPAAQASFLSYNLGISPNGMKALPVKSVKTGEFDYKIYERIVRNVTNRSPKEFKEMQKRELVAQRMRELVRTRVRVSVEEAFSAWELKRSKAVARLAHLEKAWFQRYAVDSSDKAVEAWAKENSAQIEEAWKSEKERTKADCAWVSEIFVAADAEASPEVKVERRQKIDAALGRVKNKEAFELVARQASEAASAPWGGEHGCMTEASYGPGTKELVTAAETLKPGEVSPVIETPRGFHVLKMVGKLPAADVEKRGKRLVAKRLMVPLKADELINAMASSLVERVKKGEKLDDAVKALADEAATTAAAQVPALKATGKDSPLPALAADDKPRVEISPPFNRAAGPILDSSPTEAVGDKVFELAKEEDVLEKPVTTSKGLVVLQLKEKTVAKREEFEKDRLDILYQLQQEKARDAVTRYVADLRKAAKDKIKTDARLLEGDAKKLDSENGEGEG